MSQKLFQPGEGASELERRLGAVGAEETTLKEDIPNGYISMELSTNGKLGAPKRFHTRNFDTSDLLNLALSENEELPEKVAKMLDNLILEEGVSVMDFHEKDVVESLVRLYQAFYSNVLKDIDFPWDETDLEYLQKKLGANSEEYARQYDDLRSGRWAPKVDVDLGAVETHDLPDDLKTTINLTSKATGFKVGFSFPRYGDVVVLRNFIIKEWREKDKQFATIKDSLRFRRDAEDRVRKGENISLYRIPMVPDAEKERYKEYESEKSAFGVLAIKALHLVNFDGQDVSKLTLKERMALAQDPRIDYKIMKAVNDFYEKMKVGIKEDVAMRNPLKEVAELRKYSFRFVDLLQAIKLYESDEYDIDFESAHQ
jgi:hypothetical protein